MIATSVVHLALDGSSMDGTAGWAPHAVLEIKLGQEQASRGVSQQVKPSKMQLPLICKQRQAQT